MLWLALHLPHLPLEVFTRGMPSNTHAIAITSSAETNAAVTVIAANRPAQTRGVRAGMSASAACALVSGLHTIARDAAKEHASLARIAAWSLQFTSFVSLAEPGAVLLDIEGSLKLFGGLGKLHQHIARWACAPIHAGPSSHPKPITPHCRCLPPSHKPMPCSSPRAVC